MLVGESMSIFHSTKHESESLSGRKDDPAYPAAVPNFQYGGRDLVGRVYRGHLESLGRQLMGRTVTDE